MVAGDAGSARDRTRGRIPRRWIPRGQLPLRMPSPVRIGDERPTDLHEIGEALLQHTLGFGGSADETERRHLDARGVLGQRRDLHRIGCMPEDGGPVDISDLHRGQVQMQGPRVATPAPGQIVRDTRCMHAARDGRRGVEVDAVRHRVFAGQLHADQEILAASRTQRETELGEEPRTAFDVSAVAVAASVRSQREELVDQMAMARRDLDPCEAEVAQTARRGREALHQIRHLVRRQGSRQYAAQIIGDGRRRDRLDFGADQKTTAPRVLQLRDELRPLRTHRGRPGLETGEVGGVVRTHLVRRALRGQQVHRLGDEQRRPAPRPRRVVSDEPRRHAPRLGIARGDRRVRDPVAQPQAT